MAFVGFFPHLGEAVGCSRLLHTPAMQPGRLRESTPSYGKACAFSDHVDSGTVHLVEFPENAFEASGLIHAHSKWETFDSGLSDGCAKFLVVPTPAGQTCQLPKMI